MPPVLSVITVVKNDPAGLAATRDSLSTQRWTGFEWLVADGGSDPQTLSVLTTPGRQPDWLDSRPDGGPFAGMDRALAQARGDFVLFLNAGDALVDADVLSDLAPGLMADGPDLIYGDSVEDPGDGRPRHKPSRHWRWAFYGMPAHHCAILYRRRLVSPLRLDQGYRVAGDYAFTLQALARADRVARTPRIIARFAPGGLSRRLAKLGRWEQSLIRRRVLGMPGLCSGAIYLLQIVAATARHLTPKGYSFCRFRKEYRETG